MIGRGNGGGLYFGVADSSITDQCETLKRFCAVQAAGAAKAVGKNHPICAEQTADNVDILRALQAQDLTLYGNS